MTLARSFVVLMSVLFFNLSFAKESITPIVTPSHLNKEKIALGKALFF